MESDESSSAFPMGETAQEKGLLRVPEFYQIPPSHRPSLNPDTANVPVVDLAGLKDPPKRSNTVNDVKKACSGLGFFQSLDIGPTYLRDKMEEGMQVMAINCYPPCPQPDLSLGLPPHSDYSCFTIVLHNSQGLEILDSRDGTWRVVPGIIHGALQVHVGDHLEVLSSGLYKSVVHRVTLNRYETRISIACLQSLGMDEKMETAKELVDKEHPKKFKESSFRDFPNFISKNDITEGKSFIQTLKLN